MKIRTGLLQIGFLAAALAVGASLPLAAQNAPSQTIALVDGDRVTSETEVGRRVRDRITKEADGWQSRINAAQSELQTMAQNRQQQQLTLSADALARLNQQIEEKQVELQRMQDDARRTIERMQTDGVAEVNRVLIPALEAMSNERGYQLVFDSRMTQSGSLLYFSNTLDVTDDFIARVNAASGAAQ